MPLFSDPSSLRTRPSLVAGLQAGDEDRWREFARRYGPVIHGFALKAGLTDTEAQEVVQETCIGVARNVEGYRYEPTKCRFKTWLLNLASWRVKNQWAKRQRWEGRRCTLDSADSIDADREDWPAPEGQTHEALWDSEWREHLIRTAIEQARAMFDATQFQIFDLAVIKGWSASEVSRALGVSLPKVYLTKHRVAVALRKAMARLDRGSDFSTT